MTCMGREWPGDYFTPKFTMDILDAIQAALGVEADYVRFLYTTRTDRAGRPKPISVQAHGVYYAWKSSRVADVACCAPKSHILMVLADFGFAEFVVMAGLDDWLVVDLVTGPPDRSNIDFPEEVPRFYRCDGLPGLRELAAWVGNLTFD